jgi:pimeloyl-ACP methyl ester carboxylesterase
MEPVETLHYLVGEEGPQFAIVTHPTVEPTGTGVVLCSGGWFPGSWNLNRIWVDLARSLAKEGHRVVRFDWHGSGESAGHLFRYRLDEPFSEDVLRAASLLDGAQRVVAAGICFGAVSLLEAASRIDRLEGICLVTARVPGGGNKVRGKGATLASVLRSAPKDELVKGWFDPQTRGLYLKWFRLRWRALTKRFRPKPPATAERSAMAARILDLAARGVTLRFLYGEGDSSLPAFSTDPLASVVKARGVSIETIPHDLEGSNTIASQEATQRMIADLVRTVTVRDRRDAGDAEGERSVPASVT